MANLYGRMNELRKYGNNDVFEFHRYGGEDFEGDAVSSPTPTLNILQLNGCKPHGPRPASTAARNTNMQHRGSGHPTAISSCKVGRQHNSIRKNVRDHGLGVDHPFCASVSVLSPLFPSLNSPRCPACAGQKAHTRGTALQVSRSGKNPQPNPLPAYHIHITDPWIMENAPVPVVIGVPKSLARHFKASTGPPTSAFAPCWALKQETKKNGSYQAELSRDC
ncbi:hypothetical protein BDZ45DRAFT_735157 [Acephala macrosclerotiorum]|nr:hypothetical protein BDZ45DRAFT_735157 [Acephala macrosclerotiorum]